MILIPSTSPTLQAYSIDLAAKVRLLEVASKAINKKIDKLVEEVKEITRLNAEVAKLRAE